MPFILGQLVYTSFPEVGFKVLASAQVPGSIQQAFIQQVVYQHWDSYSPPKPGYRAVYLHQVAPEHNLFGWLYNDGLDDTGRSHVPYFVCYYLAERLHTVQLEKIFACLRRGPVALSDRQRPPATLETLIAPDLWSYQPARTGVAIPLGIREHSHTALEQGNLLDLFVPAKGETITLTEAQVTRPTEAVQSLKGVIRTQVNSHSKNAKHVKPLNETVVANETTTPAFSRTALSQERKLQIVKTALLIGVSNYGTGFDSSPGAIKDVEAMKQVLQHPDIGGFAEVRTLIDPDRQAMAEAIETLFLDCQKDNLVLLYFSGHGVKDDKGKLYLSTCITRKNSQGKLVKSTAVLASFVQDIMSDSRSKQQVVILDCCFSEAFAVGISAEADPKGGPYPPDMSWLAQEDGSVDIKHQLGGPGQIILTSSASTQDAFEQKGADPSAYTYYLVEGLETGAADLNDNGEISIDELHEYTKKRVQQAAPATQPGIYAVETGQKILLAKAPIGDPKLRYRKEVERCISSGEVSFVSRSVLDVLRNSLGLVPEEAAAIEVGVLKPYQEHRQKLQHYTQVFVEAIQRDPINKDTRNRLKHFQQALGLTDTDIAPIEAQITRQIKAVQSPSQVTGWTKAQTRSRNENTTKLLNEAVAASMAIPALIKNVLPAILLRQLGTGSEKNASSPILARSNFWLFAGAGTTAVLALIGTAYGLSQWQDSQRLKTIKALIQERNYEECLTVGEEISQSSNRYPDAQELLRQCEVGVSWKNVQVQTLPGHTDTIWSLAINPNSRSLASGSGDTTIKLWNLQTGELIHTLSRGSDTVWSIAASPDGQTLASGSGDKRIKIWNLQARKLLRALSGHSDTVRTVAISSDGQTLASGSGDTTIKLWNLQTGELLRTLSQASDTVRTIAISPDGQSLASGSGDATIKLWNLQTGELLRTLSGHTKRVISVAISPDGQTLASGSVDKTVKIWNLQTGELLHTLSGHSGWVNSVTISSDGQLLVSGSEDKTVKIWNLQTGELLRTLSGHLEDVSSVTISPDGRTLASGDKNGMIRVWRTIDHQRSQ